MNTDTNMTHCFANFHMTVEEFGLWNLLRSLANKTGTLYFNGPKFAAMFSAMGSNTPYSIARRLQAKGWLVLTKESVRKNLRNTAKQFRVLSHEEWMSEHPNSCPVRSSCDDEELPVTISTNGRHKMSERSSQNERTVVRPDCDNTDKEHIDKHHADESYPDGPAGPGSPFAHFVTEEIGAQNKAEGQVGGAAVRSECDGGYPAADKVARSIKQTLELEYPTAPILGKLQQGWEPEWAAAIASLYERGLDFAELRETLQSRNTLKVCRDILIMDGAPGFVKNYDGIRRCMFPAPTPTKLIRKGKAFSMLQEIAADTQTLAESAGACAS